MSAAGTDNTDGVAKPIVWQLLTAVESTDNPRESIVLDEAIVVTTGHIHPSRFSQAGLQVPAKHDALRPSRRRLGTWLVVWCLALGLPQATQVQAQSDEAVINREYPLKALFLYNFGSYIEWPAEAFASAQAPFVIGVLGSAPVESTLKELAATKTIAGRRIVVEQFSSAEKVQPCQILFIARNVSPQQKRVALDKLKNHHVLIVGESQGFAGQGGSVNFFIESNKVRFEINPESAKQRQLKISSKLLSLAKIVPGN